jgi:hypothetical protein
VVLLLNQPAIFGGINLLFVLCGAESQVTGVLARGAKRWSLQWIFCSIAVVQGLGFLSSSFDLQQVRLCEEAGIILEPSVQRFEFESCLEGGGGGGE